MSSSCCLFQDELSLPTNTYYTGKVRDVSHARSAKRKPNRRRIVGAGDTDPRVVQKSGAMMEFLLRTAGRERGFPTIIATMPQSNKYGAWGNNIPSLLLQPTSNQ